MPPGILLLLIALLIILVICFFIIVAVSAMQVYASRKSVVPLVPVRRSALPSIMKALELTPRSILYDLGSGDGRVLESALAQNPSLRVVGLEINPLPRLISKWHLRKHGSRAQVRNENFFTADFSDATHIYVYLYPAVLASLAPTFDTLLAPGTRVVSCDFAFPDRSPIETISIPQNKTLSKTLYVYVWQ